MSDLRALLDLPDDQVNARLARCMGWIHEPERGRECWCNHCVDPSFWQAFPPAYCSEDSKRRLLGEVEARIRTREAREQYYDFLKEWVAIRQKGRLVNRAFHLVNACASDRARAALAVLEGEKNG